MDCTRLPITVNMFAHKLNKKAKNIAEPPPPIIKVKIIISSVIKLNNFFKYEIVL